MRLGSFILQAGELYFAGRGVTKSSLFSDCPQGAEGEGGGVTGSSVRQEVLRPDLRVAVACKAAKRKWA